MGLTRMALSRPVFILMLMLLAVFMGYQATKSMRVEQNPEVNFGSVTVFTVYPGAGPDEVNRLVSRKIEEAVSGVTGIQEVTSSSLEGTSTVNVQFELGTNMDAALNDTRSKVDAITGQLPEGAEKPTIIKGDFSNQPVLFLTIKSERMSNQELRDLAEDKFTDRFSRISGVSSVTVSGGDIREIQIQVDKDKLLAYKLGLADVQRAVQSATLNVPGGRVVTPNSEARIRTLGEFKTVNEIREMRLSIQDSNNPNGRPRIVRLQDIATIQDTVEERRETSRLDGSDSVTLVIQKAREGTAVEISEKAAELITQIEGQYPVKFVTTQNSAEQIEESLFDLQFALMFGIFLVAAVVYVFLHNFRGTMIVAIAIPICLMATMIVLWVLGFTINVMSMLALSLAVGVLVDDAIVVLENIYRHLRMGENPRDAALNGRSEIGLAAIAITLADVVVFLPIAFMGGIVGQFFKPLGIGFAVAVLMSLFVSFTVTPMLAARWYRQGEDLEHPTGRFAQWFEKRWNRFAAWYGRVLEWSLKHRWFVFVTGFVVLISVFMLIGGSFAPSEAVAMQTGMGPMMFAILIGFVAFGANYWPKVVSRRAWRRMILFPFLILSALLFMIPVSPQTEMIANLSPPVKLLVGLFLGFVILGIVAFFTNIFRTAYKSRLILSAVGFGAVFVVASVAGFKLAEWKQGPLFKGGFFPESDPGRVSISIQMPPGTNLTATSGVVKRIEEIVKKHPETRYVLSTIGRQSGGWGGGGSQGSNYAQIGVTLHHKKAMLDTIAFWNKSEEHLRAVSSESVAADMLQAIGRIPSAEIKVSASEGQGFGSPIQMSFRGDDPQQLVATVQTMKDRMRSGAVKGIINPDISSKPGNPEIRVIPDPIRLADVGRTPADIANAMRLLYEGDDRTVYREGGREYKIRVMMSLKDRNNPDIVNHLPLAFVQGSPVFLGQVARIERGVGLDKIERRDRQEEVRFTADLLPGFAPANVQAEIDKYLKDQNLIPKGVTIAPLGQAQAQAREMGYLLGALGLALMLVYMLLAALFDNLLYPFIIQLAQPQAMAGALLALIITDKGLNIVGFIGIIALVGLVGKNAILLVDYTNTLRGRGRNRHDALVEAGPIRLRPIMMTSIAVVLGMLPTALAIGRGSEFRETIGIIIIGGVVLSTMLTLLVIPCSYTIFDDFSNWMGRAMKRGGPPSPEEPTPVEEPHRAQDAEPTPVLRYQSEG